MNESASTLDRGIENLRALIVRFSPLGDLSTEADTRFQFIDEFLVHCLAWDRQAIRIERQQDGERTDYELGTPRAAIWEAKRSSAPFEFPVRKKPANHRFPIRALVAGDPSLKEALEQCRSYCAHRGVQIAVIANGPQIVAFLATRTDGTNPMDGEALVWNGYEQLLTDFSLLWQTLSQPAVSERRLPQILGGLARGGIPPKLSSSLLQYPRIRYTNEFQEDLRTVANLLLEDLRNLPEVEHEYYKECYCESGALSQYALLTKSVLNSRYAELFSIGQTVPTVGPAEQDPIHGIKDSKHLLAEAIAKRPIVLIGDVGVGKTSFLKNLIYVDAAEELRDALYAYVDLGGNFPIQAELANGVLLDIKKQLLVRYSIDIDDWSFVRAIYHGDIHRFRSGMWGTLAESSPSEYQAKLLEYLDSKVSSLSSHLQASIDHIARGRMRPVVVMIDNADQRSFEVQQQAFVLAETLAKSWSAFVFVAVRPKTFHQSKRMGVLSAYPQRIFTIAPPRVELMLERRLTFALKMAEGRLPIERIKALSLRVDSLAAFLKALLAALKTNKEIAELLTNITGGNMREVMELVTRFISTPNVDAKKIIETMTRTGSYRIPLHEFSKVALLGDYAHYHPDSSIAVNLFDVSISDPREHFLRFCTLGYMDSDGQHRNQDGFVRGEVVVREMQNLGFLPFQSQSVLRKFVNKKLIETTERVTFEEDPLGDLVGDIPEALRITTIGAYHIRRWCRTFSYLDAMVFDTPIFDDKVLAAIGNSPESFEISERINRVRVFRKYLDARWSEAAISVPYLDWTRISTAIESSTDEVVRGVARGAQRTNRERT